MKIHKGILEITLAIDVYMTHDDSKLNDPMTIFVKKLFSSFLSVKTVLQRGQLIPIPYTFDIFLNLNLRML